MLPVVPKVHVGDVLYATRNLRNWLQTASLMYSIKHLREGGSQKGSKGIIYTPNKKDRYVVCVNAGLVFAVFVPDRDFALFFVNASPDRAPGRIRLPSKQPRPGAFASPVAGSARAWTSKTYSMKKKPSKKKRDAEALPGTRMSPALFSSWFVHSNEKMPDMRRWPDYAHATWASLQMNAISVNGDYRLSISIPRNAENIFYSHMGIAGLGNFGNGKRMKDRGTIRSCIHYAIKTGMTRDKYQSGNFHALMLGHAAGPRIEELDSFRKNIQEWIRNPRTRKSLEEGLDEIKVKISDAAMRHILDGFEKNEPGG